MRAGLSTIQQTLTPEAASVLNHSIAEAGRRNHGQTTPLHVAATLLSSPTGFLRQACIRSHPNSSHPLQCRALELCFSVALERLPTSQSMAAGGEPPISNALMAALKRAQAHQRRGCPEQQQQPLLAVKVELEQLIISILDDPSVSRVMREASFSSPAVKATIEQSLSSPATSSVKPPTFGIGFRPSPSPIPVPVPMPNRNLYLNPRLQQNNSVQSGNQRNDDVKRVIEILLRTKKKNPVLVGDSEPETLTKELLRRIEKGEFSEGPLKNVQVIPLEKEILSDKTLILAKIKELEALIETQLRNCNGGGIILDLGDLKWLVEQPPGFGPPGSGSGSGPVAQQVVSDAARSVVAEIGKMLARFEEGSNGRLWFIGTATCETYMRCQVYHSSMENDWDLQAVPIASRSPLPGMFPRLGSNGIISSSVESLTPLKNFSSAAPTARPICISDSLGTARRMSCCPQCSQKYEQELAKLTNEDSERSSSEVKSDDTRSSLPQWLQNAKSNTTRSKTSDEEMIIKQKTQELQKKWSDTCSNLHPNFHRNLSSPVITPMPLSMTSLYNPKLLARQNLAPKLQQNLAPKLQQLQQSKNIGENLQLNPIPVTNRPLERVSSPPGSPVRTELALGRPKIAESSPEDTHKERVKDFLGCISSQPETKLNEWQSEKYSKALDTDTYKKLLKGLTEKVWWQQEAATTLATAITRCQSGNGKQRGGASKGDIWLLFTGPDRAGKKKMASVISEQVCGANPMMISLGSRRNDEDLDLTFRGKTALDRIVEAVRRNPSSVIMLEDFDEADMLTRRNIKRAMERGRLTDSYGREISLGNIIFILTTNCMPENLKDTPNDHFLDENKLASVSSGGWRLRLSLARKSGKRRANWLLGEDRAIKSRRELDSGLAFDLNEMADFEDYRTDCSHNSSDLTIDHENELGLEHGQFLIASVPHELINSLDDAIVFKPVKLGPVRRKIEKTIAEKFSSIVDNKISMEVQDEALEKILGGVWLGRTCLEEWVEKVLGPSFHELKTRLPSTILNSSDGSIVVRLEQEVESEGRSRGDWLPSEITVMV